jgi:ATP-dependent protease ClpP protease subunit
MVENTINWKRCIYVNNSVDHDLLRTITPQILSLRAESNEPITVAIDSPGGSIGLIDTIFALITGPNQDGMACRTVTVAVNHAYSAAANLLARGDYAVALPHSDILFHDVRYGGMEDVTPTKAKNAASRLKHANNESALLLANHVFRRLAWNYIDLVTNDFLDARVNYPKKYDEYSNAVRSCLGRDISGDDVKLPEFFAALFSIVSRKNEILVDDALKNLRRWKLMMQITALFEGNDRFPGLLDGPLALFKQLRTALGRDDLTDVWDKHKDELQIIITLLTEKVANCEVGRELSFAKVIDWVGEDFELFATMNDPAHQKSITRLLLKHKHSFFGPAALEVLEGSDNDKKEDVLKALRPSVQILWLFCVLLCRELFNGDHILQPVEAQILGIVDEVAGGGPVESMREFAKKQLAEDESNVE